MIFHSYLNKARSGARLQPNRNRRLRIEPLETRKLLAGASGPDVGSDSGNDDSAAEIFESQQRFQVKSLVLDINGESRIVSPGGYVELDPGDELRVTGASYSVTTALDGVLAIEGYVNKLPASPSPGHLDYSDGRFGGGEPISDAEGTHNGLENSWTVQEGWDRLTLTFIRYFGDESQVEATAHVQLQVGKPDLAIAPEMVDAIMAMELTVGEPVHFDSFWSNVGAGSYHSYLEIDVINIQTCLPEWVGVSVGNVSSGGSIEGVAENHNENDVFDVNWIPHAAGEYDIILMVDPEQIWRETNEKNNWVRLRVTVTDPAENLENTVFVVDSNGTISRYNMATDDVTVLGNSGAALTDLAVSPDGKLYGVSFTSVYRVEMQTGEAQLIAQTNRTDLNALAFLNDGSLVAAGGGSDELFEVDLSTGELTSMGNSGYRSEGDLSYYDGALQLSTTSRQLVALTIIDGKIADVQESIKVKKDAYGLAAPDSTLLVSRGDRIYEVSDGGKTRQLIDLSSYGVSEIYGLAALEVRATAS